MSEEKIRDMLRRRDAAELIHELSVYQLELEAQNDELKKMQEKLTRTRDRYHGLFENAPVGFVLVDHQGFIVDANETLCHMLDYKKSRLIGEYITLFIDKKDQDEYHLHSKKVINKSRKAETEIVMQTSSDKKLYVKVTSFSAYDSKGEYSRCLSSFTDITELKITEAELIKLNNELEEKVNLRTADLENALAELKSEVQLRRLAEEKISKSKEEIARAYKKEKDLNALKSRFIAMISHEYRTPLTIIMTATELMEKLFRNGNEQEFLKKNNMVKKAIRSMTRLLEDVLMVGRIDSNSLATKFRKVEVIPFCEKIISDIRALDNEDHEIKLKYNNPNIQVKTDPNLLKPVLNNLMMNAVKYSDGGTCIELSLHMGRKILKLEIKDRGIGILPEESEYIFEPFVRGSNIGAREGTGLGLSIVKGCIDALDGSVTIDSLPGKETTFSVVIPVK
jgi:PAS domain S-box-containing protein